jgi:hypothetical protein
VKVVVVVVVVVVVWGARRSVPRFHNTTHNPTSWSLRLSSRARDARDRASIVFVDASPTHIAHVAMATYIYD